MILLTAKLDEGPSPAAEGTTDKPYHHYTIGTHLGREDVKGGFYIDKALYPKVKEFKLFLILKTKEEIASAEASNSDVSTSGEEAQHSL